MPCNVISGKALLCIEQVDKDRWYVRIHIQAPRNPEKKYAAEDAFADIGYRLQDMPDAALKMEIGDRITVKVSYEIMWFRDYWGEVDQEIHYRKQRVIRRQPYKRSK